MAAPTPIDAALLQQEIIWTALPNGAAGGSEGRRLQVTVLVSPRLKNGARLDLFPDFADWPATLENVRFVFRAGGRTFTEGNGVTRVRQADTQLWRGLFKPETSVTSHTLDVYSDRSIHSYPVMNVMQFLKDQYTKAGIFSRVNLPSTNALRAADSFSQISISAREREGGPDTQRKIVHNKPFHAMPPGPQSPHLDFFQLDLFHTAKQPVVVRKPVTLPEIDFHQLVSLIGEYPEILRLLGIAVDFTIDLPPDANALREVSVEPMWAPAIPTVSVTPRTVLDPNGQFTAASRDPQTTDIAGRHLMLGTAKFGVVQVDVDGAAIKAINFANQLAQFVERKSEDTPTAATLPSLRSGGFSIVRTGRAEALGRKFQDTDKLITAAATNDVRLFAEDLLRGHRVDVRENNGVPGDWFSLCRRDATHDFTDLNRTAAFNDVEGIASMGIMQKPELLKDDFVLSESMFRWAGWSLCAPPPLDSVPPDQTQDIVRGKKTVFGLKSAFTPVAGSLPLLRFGHRYQFRVRTADLVGGGPSFAANAANSPANPLGPPAGFAFPAGAGTVFPFSNGSITLNSAGVASVTAPGDANLRRFFQPADSGQGLILPLSGSHATPLIGGSTALPRMAADIARAGSGDFIYLLNWHCNVRLPLAPPDPNSTLTVLLGNAARAGVQVRGMFWAGIMVPSLPAVPALVPAELLRGYLTENQAPRVFNVEAVNAINGMSAPGVDVAAILDSEHAFAASHHQKILVLGIGGQLIAYTGGIDFSADQLPPPDATAPGTPVFDVAVRLEDGGAWLALNTFKTRWNAHPNKPAGPALLGDSLPIPLPAGGPLTVQMSHTSAKGFPLPVAVQTASTALASAIRNARQFFYLEDQYCVGSPKLAAAIVEALTQTPGLTGIFVITPDACVKTFEMPDMPFRRREFLRPLVKAFPNRFLVFERLGAGTITGPTAYIHSKLMIVDDEVAIIGSVNASRRSWFHDTEAQVTIVDELNGRGGTSPGTRGWVRDLRCQVWSQHLTRPQASLGDPSVDLFIWRDIVKGTVTGSSVRPYDALAAVPRFSVTGQTLGDDPLNRLWDNVEDPY